MPSKTDTAHPDAASRLLASYRTVDGVPDELVKDDGSIRPVWIGLINAIATMPPRVLKDRFARGDQYLRDAGVFYRRYGPQDQVERDWPLSHMPVLIAEDEWATISSGLVQRAELLELVAADLYGENRLVADGHLPATLVAGNPEWLRPLVGVRPQSGQFLHFIAFDIGRGPQGQWWVLGDRTQAPSGAGFALENRMATTRVYGDLFARSNVHRLAGFFRAFRDTLQGLRLDSDSRLGILTPGPLNDTYFEHAYIARYLGFMLLEGEDLAVRDGRLLVRTIEGLKPVDVLWRRLDAAWADPLELNEDSRLGTAGLLGAVRAGNLALVNALGSGILETRAFLAFLPRICRALTGRDLEIPNVATWWCGQAAELAFVKRNVRSMTLGNALATSPLFDIDGLSTPEGPPPADPSIAAWIDQNAPRLVGQEAVRLSTTPAFARDRLVPRPMSLRIFLARTTDGWQVLPGGFARIGHEGSSVELAMQRGGLTADVWVVGRNPVPADSMLASPDTPFNRQQPAVLPSRAADNLFWLGRYVERAEFTIRVLRAYHLRLTESASSDTPLLCRVAAYLEMFGIDAAGEFPPGVIATIESASAAAGHVRDRFSIDGWLALHDLAKTVRQMRTTAKPGDDMARAMGVLLRKLSGFSGLVHENMYRFAGWRFLSIGRSLERAISLAGLLAAFADPAAPDGCLDLAVEVADSSMTHRSRYAFAAQRTTVVDLLGLDAANPRSIMYQLNEISGHLLHLPDAGINGQLSPLQRAMLPIHTSLSIKTPENLSTEGLHEIGREVAGLSKLLSDTYLT